MINRVILTGRLTNNPELKYTTSGNAVATFNLAVNRQFKNQNGEREADFIRCIIWRKSAENLTNFTHKGSLVGIEGRIQTRSYENQQGQRVYVTEVLAENFSLLESKAESERYRAQHGSSNANVQGSAPSNDMQSSNPFGTPANNQTNDAFGGSGFDSTPNNSNNAADPFAGGQQIDISDDDLPF